jgi:hypothetical protein
VIRIGELTLPVLLLVAIDRPQLDDAGVRTGRDVGEDVSPQMIGVDPL